MWNYTFSMLKPPKNPKNQEEGVSLIQGHPLYFFQTCSAQIK
jgi:hypothetical protein